MGTTFCPRVLPVVALVTVAGCSSDNNIFNRDEENIVIDVLASAGGVDFHVHVEGDCETERPFVPLGRCTSQTWDLHPLEACTPRLHCVHQVRVLEPGDGEDARLPLYSTVTTSGFARLTPMAPVESFEPGSMLEITGCGDPILIELPEPIIADTIPEADADSEVIRIQWDVRGAESLHANAQSSDAVLTHYSATCHEAGDYVELPTLAEYPLSGVTLFALGKPERHRLDIGELSAYPAAATAFGISWGPHFGDLSDFLGDVFEGSPSYEACFQYCELREEHCGQTVAGADDCAGDCSPFGFPVSCIEGLSAELEAAAECDPEGAGGACSGDATLSELCDQTQPYRLCPSSLYE